MELVTDPSLVLLDEPTSGLDSFTAKKICKTLQDLAHNDGKCIIATIHQPSSEAFMYFDKLLLMADGHIVYQGIANRAPKYFKMLGYELKARVNPADSFIKVLAVNYPKTDKDEEKIKKLLDGYYKFQVPQMQKENTEMSLVEFIPKTNNFSVAPFCLQLQLLFQRNMTFIKREPLVLIARIAIAIVQGLFALSVFWRISNNVDNMVGSMFYLSANVFVGIIYGTIATF